MMNINGRTLFYKGEDLVVIIPTKDRPQKMYEVLASISLQDTMCGKVIVVDGGASVEDVVMSFAGRVPVEYWRCEPPGQIRQRNLGISRLDPACRLVCFMDDDIVIEEGAFAAMIDFWNRCESSTAGVSFNIVNMPPEKSSRIRALFGMGSNRPGRVLRSGMTTSNCSVSEDVKVQWLCGGATVWKKRVLDEFLHHEVSSRWAIAEDLVFSYPIGKLYPLYVCSDARVRHEHVFDYVVTKKGLFHGRTQTLWVLYFITMNEDLSVVSFYYTLILRIAGKLLRGAVQREPYELWFAAGLFLGGVDGLMAFLGGRSVVDVISETT